MLKNKLDIFLVTFNRKDKLCKTLEAIFSKSSPIKDFDITILDNNSDDGTSELIDKYCEHHSNIKHIRHNRNIGANANIARCYELTTKEYMWILCDDDIYDWSSWNEVEEAVISNKEMIVVAKYAIKKNTKINLIVQATYVPSMIINTSILDDTCIRNIYDNIYTMYVQLVPVVMYLNLGKDFFVINGNSIVDNPNDYGKEIKTYDSCEQYHRGVEDSSKMYFRNKTMSQNVGFVNVIEPLQDKKLKKELLNNCLDVALHFFHPFSKEFIHFADIWVNMSKSTKLKLFYRIISVNILEFQIRERGIYVKIFGKFKTKIIPFFSAKNNKL